MKTYLLPLVFATLFTSSVFADSEMKRKDIKTVEDVKEYRAIVINKMKDRLKSDFSLRHSPFYQAQISKPKGKGYKKMKSV